MCTAPAQVPGLNPNTLDRVSNPSCMNIYKLFLEVCNSLAYGNAHTARPYTRVEGVTVELWVAISAISAISV